jgi:hypothetical protein
LGDLPLTSDYPETRDAALAAERFPLDVGFCHDCGLVQVLAAVPPERIFIDDYP